MSNFKDSFLFKTRKGLNALNALRDLKEFKLSYEVIPV